MNRKQNCVLIRTFFYIFGISYAAFIFLVSYRYLYTPYFLLKTDVISFLTGAKIIKEGNIGLLYDIETQFKYQNKVVTPYQKVLLPFRNFPVTAIFYTPLLNMNLKDSYGVVFAVNILLVVVFTILTFRVFPDLKKNKIMYFVPFLFWPSVNNMIVGQYTPVILLIFLWIYVSSKEKKDFLSGLATSLLVVKPQYLLFTPFALKLSVNKKNYLQGFIAGIIIFILINTIISKGNIRLFMDYPKFIFSTESSMFGSRPNQMYTFYGLGNFYLPRIDNSILLGANLFFYALVVGYVHIKKKINWNINKIFTLGIAATILFSVHVLTHDLMILLLPVFIIISSETKPCLSKSWLILLLTGVLPLIQTRFLILLIMFYGIAVLYYENPHAPKHHKNKLQNT